MSIDNNSTSDYVSLSATSPALQNVYGATLALWAYLYRFPGGNRYYTLFALSVGTSTKSRAAISVRKGGKLSGSGCCLDADTLRRYESGGILSTSTWMHIAVAFDYNGKTIALYLDGVLQGTSAALVWGAAPTSNTASQASCIFSDAAGGDVCQAILDDVRCYNRVLSAAEIQSIYYGRGNDWIADGLQHWYFLAEQPSSSSVTGAGTIKDQGPLQINGNPTITGPAIYAESIVNHQRRPQRRYPG